MTNERSLVELVTCMHVFVCCFQYFQYMYVNVYIYNHLLVVGITRRKLFAVGQIYGTTSSDLSHPAKTMASLVNVGNNILQPYHLCSIVFFLMTTYIGRDTLHCREIS
jgi:hypothetical protein